ncbi:MAG: ACP phosphodiesterase [Paludibacter sp.]
MNYLAHIFLSGNNPEIQIGNFIGDFVKGSKLKKYPDEIKKGIILHRLIDDYTDNHSVVKETVLLLRPAFGRYSAIIADMYFDYFLAKSFRFYTNGITLNRFAFRFYFAILLHYKHLPTKVKGFIFHFITTNRLGKYSKIKGLKKSLEIMSNYKVSALKPDLIIGFLDEHSQEIETKFHLFFPDLIEFVTEQLKSDKLNIH